MFGAFIIFLPCAACLTMAAMMFLLGCRQGATRKAVILFMVTAAYLFTAAAYEYNGTPHEMLTFTMLAAQFIAPCVLPFCWIYLAQLSKKKPNIFLSIAWIIPPVVLLVTALMLFVINGSDSVLEIIRQYDANKQIPKGMDNLVRLQVFVATYAFRAVMLLETILILCFIVTSMIKRGFSFREVTNFAFNGGRIKVLNLQLYNFLFVVGICILKIFFTRAFLLDKQWIAVLIALCSFFLIICCGSVAIFSEYEEISLKAIYRALTPIQNRTYSDEADEEEEELVQAAMFEAQQEAERTAEIIASNNGEDDKSLSKEQEDSLLAKFEDLIINQQKFLTPGLTINDIARMLGSNKTYISRLVNSTYKMTFPDYMNNLKIDYAEQYILHHRNAKQNDIAEACGFPNASAFNNTFKKFTGVTPRIWLVTHTSNQD